MQEMSSTIGDVMQGHWSEEQIGLLLTSLRAKGETIEEIAGAAQAMRRHMTKIRSSRQDELIDTCGTGGGGLHTFNISTAAALVTAAAGAPVAKHGNRAITSRSGSADALAELGVNVEADVDHVEACLEELGICFCFAPLLHRAMKHVAPVRKKLGVPTIFNMLGPLTNPAGAPYQLLGVGRDDLREPLARALAMLGTRRALVLHGEDGLGEVTLSGETFLTEVNGDQVSEFRWTPADFSLPTAAIETLQVETPAESAAAIREVLAGQPGPRRDVVVANAAAALWIVGKADTPLACAQLAAAAIDSGAAAELLARLAEESSA